MTIFSLCLQPFLGYLKQTVCKLSLDTFRAFLYIEYFWFFSHESGKVFFLLHFAPLTHSKMPMQNNPSTIAPRRIGFDRYSDHRGRYGQESGGWERDGRESASGGGNYSARETSGVDNGSCSQV
jgi:hypothetical protein